LRHVQKKAPKF